MGFPPTFLTNLLNESHPFSYWSLAKESSPFKNLLPKKLSPKEIKRLVVVCLIHPFASLWLQSPPPEMNKICPYIKPIHLLWGPALFRKKTAGKILLFGCPQYLVIDLPRHGCPNKKEYNNGFGFPPQKKKLPPGGQKITPIKNWEINLENNKLF